MCWGNELPVNECWNFVFKGTPDKLIEQLKCDSDGVDTYVEDFLLTYRAFVESTRDITSRLLAWCDDYSLRDKVFSCSYFLPWSTLYVGAVSTILSSFHLTVHSSVHLCVMSSIKMSKPVMKIFTTCWLQHGSFHSWQSTADCICLSVRQCWSCLAIKSFRRLAVAQMTFIRLAVAWMTLKVSK